MINNGRVVCEGTPAEVKSRGAAVVSQTPEAQAGTVAGTVKVIRCQTTLTAEHLLAMPGVLHVGTEAAFTIVTSAMPEASLREMLALDRTLSALDVQSPALEDAFLALTQR